MATSWTQADLNALEAAIATGARVVQYADKRVEHRDLAEMEQIRRQMRQALGLNAPGGGRKFAQFGKGT